MILAEKSLGSIEEISKSLELLKRMESPISRLVQRDLAFERRIEKEERLEFLKWLSPLDFQEQHREVSSLRLQNSGKWVMEHKAMLRWRNASSSSIMLLRGVPGSGKSMLASRVIDSLSEQSTEMSMVQLAYFYCKRRSSEPERQCPRQILASILRQLTIDTSGTDSLCRENMFSEFRQRQEKAEKDGFRMAPLRINESLRLIEDVTAVDPVFIVLDALDEVEEAHRYELIEALTSLIKNAQNVVKILVTSRDDDQIIRLLAEAETLFIGPSETKEDMALFIRHHIQKRKNDQTGFLSDISSAEFESQLYERLKDKAGEM